MPPEWHERYATANRDHRKVSAKWESDVSSKCRGEPCTCQSHPYYQVLVASVARVNGIYDEQRRAKTLVYEDFVTRATAVLHAKERYRSERRLVKKALAA